MIAVDTNILVYAHRADLPWHANAAKQLTGLAEAPGAWALPWPCLHEFYAKVTHPRIFAKPSSIAVATGFVSELLRSPSVRLLVESHQHWETLESLLRRGKVVGPMIHDAKIAALCLDHGVSELWTADRDFGRFPGLKIRNPLIA